MGVSILNWLFPASSESYIEWTWFPCHILMQDYIVYQKFKNLQIPYYQALILRICLFHFSTWNRKLSDLNWWFGWWLRQKMVTIEWMVCLNASCRVDIYIATSLCCWDSRNAERINSYLLVSVKSNLQHMWKHLDSSFCVGSLYTVLQVQAPLMVLWGYPDFTQKGAAAKGVPSILVSNFLVKLYTNQIII